MISAASLDDYVKDGSTLEINVSERLGSVVEGTWMVMLWINQPAAPTPEMPFGGVKDSGNGSKGGPEAMEAYLVAKAVSIVAV